MTDPAPPLRRSGWCRAPWVLAAAFILAACVGGGGGSAPAGGSPASAPLGGPQTAASVAAAVNAERAAAGLAALSPSAALAAAAQVHADDMAANGLSGHTGSDGSDMGSRVRRAGYDWRRVAENVAVGQGAPAAVVADWMDSPPHRRNILDPAVAELGVGYAAGPPVGNAPGHFWVLVFAAP